MTGSLAAGAQLVDNNIGMALKYNKVRLKCVNNGGGFANGAARVGSAESGGCSHERPSKRVASHPSWLGRTASCALRV